MGGGLMQLVAYGAQDIYLTGNPQITFFKVVYRRHTNFSMECVQQTISGSSTLAAASTANGTVTVSRNGDLLSGVHVRCDQDVSDGINGDQLITDVTVEIGGQQIDKHTTEFMNVMNELKTPASKADGLKYMTGGFTNSLATNTTGGHSQQSIIVPLQFWFCNNPGLALPLIALQYHEVKMKFTWTSGAAGGNKGVRVCRLGTTAVTPTVEVWCDYVYLDTDERRRFAQVSHEYLIEQLQYQTEGTPAQKYKLNFNHPVKELIWTNATANITSQKAKLTLNGHDRLAEQDREYYQLLQPMRHHTSVPGYNIKESETPKLINPSLAFAAASGICGDMGATTHNATETGITAVTIGTGSLTYATGEIGTNITWNVGDLFTIAIEGAGLADQATPHNNQVHQVTALSATAVSFLPALAGVTLTDGDAIRITRIASAQNPQSRCSQLANDVNVYSFALKPEEHQPSGTCNFSRIDTAYLNFSAATVGAGVANIYAINYNVLRIMSGMGGLAYSN